MFVVKFNQTSNAPFIADNNGNFPFIGTVMAGTAKSTIINGTMFKRNNLVENKLYFCDNVEEVYEGKQQWKVLIISEINPLDFPEYRTKFGAGMLSVTKETPSEEKDNSVLFNVLEK